MALLPEPIFRVGDGARYPHYGSVGQGGRWFWLREVVQFGSGVALPRYDDRLTGALAMADWSSLLPHTEERPAGPDYESWKWFG